MKLEIMKLYIPIVFSALLLSCGNTKEVTESTSTEVKENTEATVIEHKDEIEERVEKVIVEDLKSEKDIEIKAHFGEFVESDELSINSVIISGNILIINVTYSGGCNEHSFDMVGSQMVAKSLPPIRQIKLIHKNNGDLCKSLVTKTIIVDIREMADIQESGSEIILNLQGYQGRISYVFQ